MTRRWLLAAAFLCSSAACFAPIADVDLPWHLSAGRFIVEHRRVPAVDFLSWTEGGKPWIDFEWGAQVLDYALAAAGGVAALWFFKAAVFLALMALFVAFLRLRGLPDSWLALALPPFVLSLVPFVDIRPEIFSFLFCLAQLDILEARRAGALRLKPAALLLLHAALYALWVNLHAGYPLGLALCLMYGIGEAAEGKPDALWFGLTAAGLFGTLLNPYGPKIYAVFLSHWEHRAVLRSNIVEWGAPNPLSLDHRVFAALLVFCAAAPVLGFLKKRRPPYAHGLALAGFGLLSLRFERQVPYVSLVAFPAALASLSLQTSASWWLRLRPYALALCFAFLGATGLQALQSRNMFRGIDRTHARDLAAAGAFLRSSKSELGPLRMYNGALSGGPLGLMLFPDYKVFMDGRYIFTDFLPLIRRIASSPLDWQAFMREQKIDLVFLDYQLRFLVSDRVAGSFLWRPADVYALPRREWALVYWDGSARIWVRRSAAPRAWLEAHEFRYLHPGDLEFLSAGVKAGAVPLASVLPEVSRYVREIGDPGETARLREWLTGLSRTPSATSAENRPPPGLRSRAGSGRSPPRRP